MKIVRMVEDLVNEEINGIAFVMDYVEIHFNGAVIRCFSKIQIDSAGKSAKFPEPGSRDALCSLIGSTVRDVKLVREKSLVIHTDRKQRIDIPLGCAPESAHFVPRLEVGAPVPIQVFN